VRLQRGTLVAGVEPSQARDLARAVHGTWTTTELAAHRVHHDLASTSTMLTQLEQAGYLVSRQVPLQYGGGLEWETTVRGGALTMASFLRPIPRAKADRLVDGLLARVRHYNGEPDLPLLIFEIGIFGSYLDPTVDVVGDVDVTAVLRPRSWINQDGERYRYAQRFKRQFSSYTDLVLWPEQEARLHLKSHSPYLNIHQEDISRFTDQHRVLYQVPKSVLRDAWRSAQPAAT